MKRTTGFLAGAAGLAGLTALALLTQPNGGGTLCTFKQVSAPFVSDTVCYKEPTVRDTSTAVPPAPAPVPVPPPPAPVPPPPPPVPPPSPVPPPPPAPLPAGSLSFLAPLASWTTRGLPFTVKVVAVPEVVRVTLSYRGAALATLTARSSDGNFAYPWSMAGVTSGAQVLTVTGTTADGRMGNATVTWTNVPPVVPPPPPPDTTLQIVRYMIRPSPVSGVIGAPILQCPFIVFRDGAVAKRAQDGPECDVLYATLTQRRPTAAQQALADQVCLVWTADPPGPTFTLRGCDTVGGG